MPKTTTRRLAYDFPTFYSLTNGRFLDKKIDFGSLCFCCPSCPSKNVNKTYFIKHAVTSHPHSQSTIESLEDDKAVIKSENEGNKEAHPLEKDSLLSKKAVVSLPKLSDATLEKYTKVFVAF